MRRRQVLTAGATGLAAGIAGCGDIGILGGGGDDGPRHPLADTTATVRVDDNSDTDHDVVANAREALDYWAENGPEFAGFDVDFDVVTDENPDVVIEYVDGPDPCSGVEGYSERVLGCAPLLTPEHRLPADLTAIVVAGARPYGQIRTTTKHELGHVLGLDHDDPPAAVMSDDPADRIPLYGVRVDIWEATLSGRDRARAATERFNDGIESWNRDEYETAEEAFRSANEAFEEAVETFGDARDRTATFEDGTDLETVDLPGLRTHLDQLIEKTDLAAGFTASMTSATQAAATEDYETANRHHRVANDDIAAFNQAPSPQTRDVAVALGLVRGFDRDDAVVGESDGET